MGKNKQPLDFDELLKKLVWQDFYVLTQHELAKSQLSFIEEFKAKGWLEFSGSNGKNRDRFYSDYRRARLCFNGKNNVAENKVLEQFFGAHKALQENFIDCYSQGILQTISAFFMYLKAKRPEFAHYMFCGKNDNSIINFTLVNDELFAELLTSDMKLMPFINHQQFNTEKKICLSGGIKVLFKFKPQGFELQTITLSNTLLKSIVMGEPLDFESEQVRQAVLLEEHKAVEIRKLARCILSMLSNKIIGEDVTSKFFIEAIKLLSIIATPKYSNTLMAKLAQVVLGEALDLQPKIAVKNALPLVTNLLVQQTRLVRKPHELAVIHDYHRAAEKVYAKPWGKRLGGAALICVGVLAVIGMAVVAGVTFGAGLLPASALLLGLVYGICGAATVGGGVGGLIMEYKAHQETNKKSNIEGASKITDLAHHTDQIQTTFLRRSKARAYAEARPDIFDTRFIKAIQSKKMDDLNFLHLLRKRGSLSEKSSSHLASETNQENIVSPVSTAGMCLKKLI